MKLEAIVRQLGNSNEGYIKIRKTVEEKVVSILSDAKPLLRIALLSLVESIREGPDRYSSLIYHNTSPPADYISQYYSSDSYGQQQQHPSQDYIDVLIQEAEKLYNKLAKELGDESISDYAFSILSSLPVLSQSDEKNESHPRQTTAAIQTHMHTEEHRLFTQSEIDDDDD
jgi:hypothetical protein